LRPFVARWKTLSFPTTWGGYSPEDNKAIHPKHCWCNRCRLCLHAGWTNSSSSPRPPRWHTSWSTFVLWLSTRSSSCPFGRFWVPIGNENYRIGFRASAVHTRTSLQRRAPARSCSASSGIEEDGAPLIRGGRPGPKSGDPCDKRHPGPEHPTAWVDVRVGDQFGRTSPVACNMQPSSLLYSEVKPFDPLIPSTLGQANSTQHSEPTTVAVCIRFHPFSCTWRRGIRSSDSAHAASFSGPPLLGCVLGMWLLLKCCTWRHLHSPKPRWITTRLLPGQYRRRLRIMHGARLQTIRHHALRGSSWLLKSPTHRTLQAKHTVP